MNILVTGHKGFIGFHIYSELLKGGCNLYGYYLRACYQKTLGSIL